MSDVIGNERPLTWLLCRRWRWGPCSGRQKGGSWWGSFLRLCSWRRTTHHGIRSNQLYLSWRCCRQRCIQWRKQQMRLVIYWKCSSRQVCLGLHRELWCQSEHPGWLQCRQWRKFERGDCRGRRGTQWFCSPRTESSRTWEHPGLVLWMSLRWSHLNIEWYWRVQLSSQKSLSRM